VSCVPEDPYDLVDDLPIERRLILLSGAERADELRLAVVHDLAVAQERGQHLLVAQILAPALNCSGL
jgi:hypothetical protein